MYFLLSGEGPSDIGSCANGAGRCEGDDFRHGPMALFVDRIVQALHGYSAIEAMCCGFVSEVILGAKTSEWRAGRKGLGLPGKRRGKETRYFYNQARVLARIAQDEERQRKDVIIAVLFRDSDGTASAGRGLWDDKRQSMLDGFSDEGFGRGVPMIPRPKSEAWLICALKKNPYQACQKLEQRSGNDHAPNSLKGELQQILGADAPVIEALRDMIEDETIDPLQIVMPSFQAFRDRLEEVMASDDPTIRK